MHNLGLLSTYDVTGISSNFRLNLFYLLLPSPLFDARAKFAQNCIFHKLGRISYLTQNNSEYDQKCQIRSRILSPDSNSTKYDCRICIKVVEFGQISELGAQIWSNTQILVEFDHF
jgi:hypothetical protein